VNRRRFIQLVTSSAIGVYSLDPERLLWVPGEKTIFIPPPRKLIFASEVVAAEMERVMSVIGELFEKDNLLYEVLSDKPEYKHETGDRYKTVQIYHGYKIGSPKE
jgi:hypothetical protein